MNRKVIFVGGTSFSGSTFVDLMLANDPHGFSCGEVRWLFSPRRPTHTRLECGCGEDGCTLWPRVYRNGLDRLYESIFEERPEVKFIVDSSKSPFWIRDQGAKLRSESMEVKNLLVWKTPLEFADSSIKRGRDKTWSEDWTNYHLLYMTLVRDWRSVKYKDLVENGLQSTCQYLGIPYFEGKKRYWEKTHHLIFGSHSARFHLYDVPVAQRLLERTFDADRMHLHRKIYYREVKDSSLEAQVRRAIDRSSVMQRILVALEANSVNSTDARHEHWVRLPAPRLASRTAKYHLRNFIGRRRYGNTSIRSRELVTGK